jgi:hypothetical protein
MNITIAQNFNSKSNLINMHANGKKFTFAIAANAEKAASLTSGVPSFRHCKIQISVFAK